MKHECSVARDLMPLCIDGVASEESSRMVAAHMADCEPCAEHYRLMKEELPGTEDGLEEAAASFAARKIRRKRRSRILLAGLLGMMAGLLIFLLVSIACQEPPLQFTKDLALTEYKLQLHRLLADDQVVLTSKQKDPKVFAVYGWTVVNKGDSCLIHVGAKVSDPVKHTENNDYYFMTLMNLHVTERGLECNGKVVEEIRQGTETEYVTLYRAGNIIPEGSPEMEYHFWQIKEYATFTGGYANLRRATDPEGWTKRYSAVLDKIAQASPEMRAVPAPTADDVADAEAAKWITNEEFHEKYSLLFNQYMRKLATFVPEWQ